MRGAIGRNSAHLSASCIAICDLLLGPRDDCEQKACIRTGTDGIPTGKAYQFVSFQRMRQVHKGVLDSRKHSRPATNLPMLRDVQQPEFPASPERGLGS